MTATASASSASAAYAGLWDTPTLRTKTSHLGLAHRGYQSQRDKHQFIPNALNAACRRSP